MAKSKPPKAAPVVEATEGVLDTVLLDGVGAEEPAGETAPAAADGPPPIDSPDWTPYVLSKLNPDEVYDGLPCYKGVVRVAEQLLGPVISTKVTVAQAPNVHNGNHSAVAVDMAVDHPAEFTWLGHRAGRVINYADASDVFSGNGQDDFFPWHHSLATCTTRTKSRVLRDALRLTVYLREELSEAQPGDANAEGYMNGVQARVIDLKAAKTCLNIDAAKYLRGVWRKFEPNLADGYEDLNRVPYQVAAKAVALLQPWQQKDNRAKIPEELRGGYDPEWKAGLACLK